MEYVHIPLLTEVMTFQIHKVFEVGAAESAMACLLCVVGLSGTDFCRGMPRIGGKRLWELLLQQHQGGGNTTRKLRVFKAAPSSQQSPGVFAEYDEDIVCDQIMTR